MSEICDELSAIGETVSEEHQVVYLLKLKGQTKPVQVKKKTKMGAFKVTVTQDDDSTDSESTGLVVQLAMSSERNARD